MEDTTIITALYNIQRESNGDGRRWQDYLDWFCETLKLPLNMIIYIANDNVLIEMIHIYRPTTCSTKIILQELHEIPYASYEPIINDILNQQSYRMKIRIPERVECILPFYNIIQYSKFQWLARSIQENPFNSQYFFWMDAGISRFIPRDLYSKIKHSLDIPINLLTIQHNHLLYHYPINDSYLWDAQCLMCGTMFGGGSEILLTIATRIDQELKDRLSHNWINNEQILLAYLWMTSLRDKFHLIFNNTSKHLCLFEKIFINDK